MWLEYLTHHRQTPSDGFEKVGASPMMTPEDNDFEIRQWRISTAQWLGTDGANWRGDENRAHAMLVMLDELHLTDAEDKVAALTQAYEELRRRGLIEEEKL